MTLAWKINLAEYRMWTPKYVASFYLRDADGFEISSVTTNPSDSFRDNLANAQIAEIATSAQLALQRHLQLRR
ncbi:MAG TPA: hypothetical protein VII56_03800 [Rhizomicrobium sp.]